HCWKCRRAGRGSFHQDKLFCVSLLGETFLTNVDLSKVIGLDTCRHLGPSSIDHRTLEKSPNLPLAFLRGVGLPDGLIYYLPSLLKQAIQFYSCFISYSAKDEDVAERLHADPQRRQGAAEERRKGGWSKMSNEPVERELTERVRVRLDALAK